MNLSRTVIAGSACLALFVWCTAVSLAGPSTPNPEFSLQVGGPCGELIVKPGSVYEEWRDITLTTSNNPTVGTTRTRTCFETDESGEFVFTRRTGECDFGSQMRNAFFNPYAKDPRNGAVLT